MTLDGAGRRRGCVHDYDSAAGYGTLDDGEHRWWFHCTAIADGTREIEPGTAVSFELHPGRSGQWEAHKIESLTPG